MYLSAPAVGAVSVSPFGSITSFVSDSRTSSTPTMEIPVDVSQWETDDSLSNLLASLSYV